MSERQTSLLISLITFASFSLLAKSAEAQLTFRWMGVSGFVLTDGTSTLLFDPAVTPTPISSWVLPFQTVTSDTEEFKYWAKRCQIEKLDATFVNHTHTDHAIDAPTAVQLFGGILAGSKSLRQIGLGHGLPDSSIRVLNDRDELKIGTFTVQAFTTPHAPHIGQILFADGEIESPLQPGSSPWDYRVGEMRSYWITHPDGKILFQAPSRILPRDVLAELKPDTLLLTIANRESSEILINRRVIPSGAKKVIPLHWDNFFYPLVRDGTPHELWFQNTQEFDTKFKKLASERQLIWPTYCQPIQVGIHE